MLPLLNQALERLAEVIKRDIGTEIRHLYYSDFATNFQQPSIISLFLLQNGIISLWGRLLWKN